MKRITTLFLGLLFLASCGKQSTTYLYDNDDPRVQAMREQMKLRCINDSERWNKYRRAALNFKAYADAKLDEKEFFVTVNEKKTGEKDNDFKQDEEGVAEATNNESSDKEDKIIKKYLVTFDIDRNDPDFGIKIIKTDAFGVQYEYDFTKEKANAILETVIAGVCSDGKGEGKGLYSSKGSNKKVLKSKNNKVITQATEEDNDGDLVEGSKISRTVNFDVRYPIYFIMHHMTEEIATYENSKPTGAKATNTTKYEAIKCTSDTHKNKKYCNPTGTVRDCQIGVNLTAYEQTEFAKAAIFNEDSCL
jgi:hypothetical protein